MRRPGAVALLAAIFATAAWWALSPGRGAPRPDVEDGSVETATREAKATLVGRPAPAPAILDARSASTLHGVVTREGIPCAARVEIRLVPSQSRFAGGPTVESLRGWFDTPAPPPPPLATGTAGPDGRYEIRVPGTGYFEALALAGDGESGYSHLQILALGTRVELNLAIRSGANEFEGRVVRSDGSAWVGRVTAASDTAPSRYLHRGDVATDERGRFTIRGLPTGTATVTAFRGGELVVSRTGISVPHDGPYELVIDEGFSTLTGSVVDDADGKPIGDALLVAFAWGQTGGFRAAARSAADGEFAISWQGGRYDNLYAAREGYAGIIHSAREVRAPMEVRLARTASAAGRVVRSSDGTPVAGATVRALSLREGTWSLVLAEVTADAEGRYLIEGLPPGDVALVGSAPGLRSPRSAQRNGTDWGPLTATLVPGARTEKEVRLVAAASIAGRTIDTEGNPVAGAIVRLGNLGNDPAWVVDSSFHQMANGTDANGEFLIDGLPPDTSCTLEATSPGRPNVRGGPLRLRAGEATRIDLVFPAGARITVLVLDEAGGAPLSGARVRAQPGAIGETRNAASVEAATDAGGRAILSGLPAGPLALEVSSNGRGTVRSSLDTSAGSITVRLSPGRVLAGRLLRPDGSPPARAVVSLFDSATGVPGPTRQTEPDGTFRFEDLPDASFELRATAMDGGRLTANETLRPAEGVEVRLVAGPDAGARPPRSGATNRAAPPPPSRPSPTGDPSPALAVLVTDGEGKPIPSASTRLVFGRSSYGGRVTAGRATFDRKPDAKDAAVEVWGARSRYGIPLPLGPARVPVPRDADVVSLTLPPELAVEGTVIGPDGKGAEGVTIMATTFAQESNLRMNPYPYEAYGSARTGADGRFRLGGLADEEVALVVRPPAGSAPVDTVRTRGGARGVEIRLQVGVTPRLRVVDPAGAPLDGANVRVSPPGAASRTYDVAQRSTDPDGGILLDPLDPTLSYRLEIAARNRGDLVPHVVERWTPKDETIVVPRAAAVRGVLVDTEGKPVAKAWIGRAGEDRRAVALMVMGGALTSEDGRFEIRGIPEGSVTLRAMAPGTLAVAEATIVAKPEATEVTMVVDLRASLDLRVEGWAEAMGGQTGNAVLFDGPPTKDALRTSTRVGADGTLSVRGVLRGHAYTLWIAPQKQGLHVLTTGIRWSGEPVVATLSRGASISGTLTAPPGAENLQVSALQGGLSVMGIVQANGRYVVSGVPPGDWRIFAYSFGEPSARGEATAPAGGTADIELKEERGP